MSSITSTDQVHVQTDDLGSGLRLCWFSPRRGSVYKQDILESAGTRLAADTTTPLPVHLMGNSQSPHSLGWSWTLSGSLGRSWTLPGPVKRSWTLPGPAGWSSADSPHEPGGQRSTSDTCAGFYFSCTTCLINPDPDHVHIQTHCQRFFWI